MASVRYPKRKNLRLTGFDYSSATSYHITVCTCDNALVLSKVLPGNKCIPAVCELSMVGEIVEYELWDLERRFSNLSIDKYVIMPNHIHILMTLCDCGAEVRSGIPAIVQAFKSLSTRKCRQAGYHKTQLFQRSYNDRIIRDEDHYRDVWYYIDTNPDKWTTDEYYREWE